MSAYFYVMYQGGWSWPQPLASTSTLYLQATTACLAGIVVTQIANVFACRSPNASVLALGIFSNRLVLAGIATEVILAGVIIYTPLGNSLFACAPLGINVWLLLIPFALLLLGSDETRKIFVRRRTLRAKAAA
jgi:sodium/potassium-transporting ATPase subunit alpha